MNLDPSGQLWIGTDQKGVPSATADGAFIMQTADPSPYLLNTAYLAPIGAAIGGAAFDAATKTIFAAVRRYRSLPLRRRRLLSRRPPPRCHAQRQLQRPRHALADPAPQHAPANHHYRTCRLLNAPRNPPDHVSKP